MQHYIPISRARIKQRLFQMDGVSEELRVPLEKVSEMLEAIWHHSAHSGLERLKAAYESMDPDQVGTPDSSGAEQFLEDFTEFLEDGNWERISDEELQEALEGEDVFPISLDVRFDEFTHMRMYKLGEIGLSDVRQNLYQSEGFEVVDAMHSFELKKKRNIK